MIRTSGMALQALGTTEQPRGLRTVGLFSGVGGLELGLEKAGHETIATCEIEAGARAVLEQRFGRRVHDDVCTMKALPAGTELVVGGFPCQDLSQAGRTAGIGGSRSGLVTEVFRLLRTRSVPWLVLENVPFMLQLGRGRALDVIVSAIEDLGYNWAYRVVDSRAFGLPQRRRRVLLVASKCDDPRKVLFADEAGAPPEADRTGLACGFYWTEGNRGLGWAVDAIPTLKSGSTIGVPSPPAIWMPDGRIVTPDIRDAERLQGFEADWTKPAEASVRGSYRWRLVGNAVSVPVAKWLGGRLSTPGDFEERGAEGVSSGKGWPTCAWNIGRGRFTRELSEWPKRFKYKSLHEFLRYEPKPLSRKATAGFRGRLEASCLNYPPEFLEALVQHERIEVAA